MSATAVPDGDKPQLYPPRGPRRLPPVPGLAELGAGRISYSARMMPLLAALRARFQAERPFDGLSVAACLHVTAETAVFIRALRAGGARVALAASNPLSTQDDIAAALAAEGVHVFAKSGVDRVTYYEHILAALDASATPLPSGATPPGAIPSGSNAQTPASIGAKSAFEPGGGPGSEPGSGPRRNSGKRISPSCVDVRVSLAPPERGEGAGGRQPGGG